ncbi:MAG: cupin domain-containing protein [Bacteroidales bacterium]|nr:cupin domain-containing protein [Bacteroidales bacterium]
MLQTEWTILPGMSGLPLQKHPYIRQFIRIKSGYLRFYLKNEWKTFAAGDELIIDKNLPYTFNNTTSNSAKFVCSYDPAMGLEQYFKGLYKFANSGLVQNQTFTFKSVLGLSALWSNYPVEIKPVNPPNWLVRILAFTGKIFGKNFR